MVDVVTMGISTLHRNLKVLEDELDHGREVWLTVNNHVRYRIEYWDAHHSHIIEPEPGKPVRAPDYEFVPLEQQQVPEANLKWKEKKDAE